MADFLGHFIPWKDWNKQITLLNSLEKARYYEGEIFSFNEPSDDLFKDHLFQCDSDEYFTIYFSAKKEKILGIKSRSGFFRPLSYRDENSSTVEGWKTKIRTSVFEKDGEQKNVDRRWSDQTAMIYSAFNLDRYSFNSYNDVTPKMTSLPKEVQEWKDEQTVHKDRYGVLIEKGDYIAFTKKDSKYVTIEKVDRITETLVNHVPPFKVTIVRSVDPNKKLGW